MLTQEELISAQPLADRTVVITRAREQAAEFASELERFGARVFECPTIVITEPESYALFDEALDNLFGYDWIVFSSVNSVNYFLRRLESTGHDPSEIDDLRVCAIGSATAESLAESHVHVDVVPQN
ncbi:MAG TPA: uroporphyrinogen-III synthase, partial [Pyrinomonadaceae bacterium]|nr:uroporphyrinogen-III synthase [Pyrinomonadaceae bacterium]